MDIEALLTEREGYVRRGLKNRVAQVDALIAEAGYGVETPDGLDTAVAVPVEVETADAEPVKRGRKPSH